jgi:predicted transposase/invertase (TIGR01784 family)
MEIIDPKSDLGFKSVMAHRPKIFMNVINTLIPLPKPVVEIKYINPELIAETNIHKNTILDVYCMDAAMRHFLVEMQMSQVAYFMNRTLLNATKIYSRQILKNDDYSELQPVYSINLLNHNIEKNTELWHHEYKLSHQKINGRYLEDLNLIFFELPKWKKYNKFDIENPLDQWLQYFTNPKFYTMMTLEERQKFEEISEAVEILNVKKYTPEQLRAYDLYLDNIRVQETGLAIAEKRGIEKGRIEGIEEGMEKGIEFGVGKGREKEKMEIFLIISELKKMELTIEQIANKYGVTQEKVFEIKKLIS